MLELLIPSQTRIKLLTLFLMNPGREYYIREIERTTGENYAAIYSELANLESLGLLSKMRKGNQVFFSVNQDFFLYHELQQIILKTEGVGRVLRGRHQAAPRDHALSARSETGRDSAFPRREARFRYRPG